MKDIFDFLSRKKYKNDDDDAWHKEFKAKLKKKFMVKSTEQRIKRKKRKG